MTERMKRIMARGALKGQMLEIWKNSEMDKMLLYVIHAKAPFSKQLIEKMFSL